MESLDVSAIKLILRKLIRLSAYLSIKAAHWLPHLFRMSPAIDISTAYQTLHIPCPPIYTRPMQFSNACFCMLKLGPKSMLRQIISPTQRAPTEWTMCTLNLGLDTAFPSAKARYGWPYQCRPRLLCKHCKCTHSPCQRLSSAIPVPQLRFCQPTAEHGLILFTQCLVNVIICSECN